MATRTVDLGPVVGPQGPAGPNEITTATETDLTGVLMGDGSNVGVKPVDAAPTPSSTNLVTSGGVYGVVSNRNLLDNGWFTVNQRGQNSYTGNAYTVDRWRFQNNSGTCTVVSGGITFSNLASGYGYFTQILDFTMDGAKTYTLSVIADGQVFSAKSGSTGITLPSGLFFYFANSTQISLRVPGNLNSSEVISAVKLELGSVSTLVNDAPPNFAEELAKCQRYCYVVKAPATINLTLCAANAYDANNVYAGIAVPPQMRTPTLSLSSSSAIKIGTSGFTITPSSVSVYGYAAGMATMQIAATSLTAGTTYRVGLMAGESIIFSADL